jgi:predicted dienelactone hydrolase
MIFSLLKKGLVLCLLAGLALALLVGGYIGVLAVSRRAVQALPAPSGPYAVGRTELDWTDPARSDPLAEQADLPRELAIWIWYPAQADASQATAPYFPPAWAQARNQDQGVGILIERELTKLQTHSYENASLASTQATYPVLIMEPGLGPAIPDYTVLAENLASHGYIVVGINPTYSSNLVVFPDGRVVTRSDMGTIPDSATRQELDQIGNSLLAVWAKDVSFVLDRLQSLNASPGSTFEQRLDLEQVGVFGHSFGGATALAFCEQDPRCKAGADLDGTTFSSETGTSLPVPFLVMSEDYSTGCDWNCAALRQIAGLGQPGTVYDLSVQGARHFNFGDLPLRIVPAARPLLQAAGYAGSIDPARGEQIASAYLLAFFDKHLRNMDSGLLDGPSSLYPEVQFH